MSFSGKHILEYCFGFLFSFGYKGKNILGLCLGDSGGPLFKTFQTEDNSRMSVLIGIVSRGTGSRGNCGGLDNATHYVRIKKFLDWILVIDIKLTNKKF